MVGYICKNCNYKFKRKITEDCPYCGKFQIEEEKTASELIDDVERMLKE